MKNKMYLNVTLTFLFACLMASTSFAQWTDNGTKMTTGDNVNVGANSDLYSLYVRTDKAGWQGRFANRNGAGADVYLSHGNGFGMNVVGRTLDNKYTLRLANLDGSAHMFYNDGRAALGLRGAVGIGFASPATKLHVKGVVRTSNTGDLDNFIELSHGGTNSYINHGGVGRIDFRFGGINKMVLAPSGNLGIGTDTPDNKLDVKGTIRAEEVKVELGWSDYVFYDDYELPTLEEEEEHIEENGHLLGFESEKTMAGEIQLGDVAKRQQAKIEEIMLHLIELKKENDELKKEMETLKAKVKK